MLTEEAANPDGIIFYVLLLFVAVYLALSAGLTLLLAQQWRRPVDNSRGRKEAAPSVT